MVGWEFEWESERFQWFTIRKDGKEKSSSIKSLLFCSKIRKFMLTLTRFIIFIQVPV